MRTLYVIAFALFLAIVTGTALAGQIYPPDPAPPGCETQITMDWTIDAGKTPEWTMVHETERDKPAPNCGMSIAYPGGSFTYTGTGLACNDDGACIYNYASPEGSTWLSRGTAPTGAMLDRGSVFNGTPLLVETPVPSWTPTPSPTPTLPAVTPSPSPTAISPTPSPTAVASSTRLYFNYLSMAVNWPCGEGRVRGIGGYCWVVAPGNQ